jgi:hypothetical protein
MTAKATYPVNVIAKLLDLTPRRVQHLANEGVIPRAEKGRYELVSAVRGYIRYLRDRAMGKDGAVIPDIAARGGPTTLSLQTLNERITVILGPSWFLSEQHVDIQNGDPLVVEGAKMMDRRGRVIGVNAPYLEGLLACGGQPPAAAGMELQMPLW